MWIVIHMAKSLALAQRLRKLLAEDGFFVKILPIYRGISDENNYYELMVPQSEAAEARQSLMDRGLC